MARKSKKLVATQKPKQKRLSQSEVPGYPLQQALRIPQAISDNYAGSPTKPLHVASALEISPSSSYFRQLCGSAIAYGLTEGAYNAAAISLLPLGKRATRPLAEGQDLEAKREALLKPRVTGEFLRKYNNSPLPTEKIARNVLQEMGVPTNKLDEVYDLIITDARSVGFINEIKGKSYVDLVNAPQLLNGETSVEPTVDTITSIEQLANGHDAAEQPQKIVGQAQNAHDARNKRVFITHGKNKAFLEPIKKLLQFGELSAVVSVEKQSVAKPVPEKVLDDMRNCGAAIIHVDAEQSLIDAEANEVTVINSNVLIEIGAAMALYGRRFILLVNQDVKLPSNLQGLYEVRYSGETLDGDVTIRLLEAINDIKSYDLPHS